MDIASRIAQFENMAQADPTNEMAHFSLGTAYSQAGRHADAAESYLRCVSISPEMSKAYQLAGDSLIKAGDKRKATSVLTQGFIISSQKGDLMPKRAMAELLKSIGEEPPEIEDAPAAAAAVVDEGPVPEGMIRCLRTGKIGTKFVRPPFKGRVGAWIGANIAKETFDLWIRQGTKVINEMRLDLSRDKDGEIYDQQMRDYLGIDEETYQRIMAQPVAS